MAADVEELSIGAVAQASGLSVHAIRFFEREGLFLRDIPRNAGGRRVFERQDIEWLRLCNRLRKSGMPLARIGKFVELVRAGTGNESERLELLREHEAEVRTKIDELYTCLEVIHGKVTTYERHVAEGTATGVWSPT